MKTRGKERRLKKALVLSIVMIFVFIWSATVFASYFDGAVPDGKIVENKYRLWSAGDLAVDGNGTLYVVDSLRNHILKYNASGAFLGDIKIKQPSAISVTDNGTIYVGSNRDYSVAIIKSDKTVGYLGSGPGEFKSVKDLAFDKVASEVYVVDNVDGKVKIYDSNGKYLRSITGLHLPIAVAISGSEVYVLDTPLAIFTDGQHEEVSTSGRITVFNRDGALIRSFDSPSAPDTHMVTPTDIAVSNGYVYVSDSAKNGIHVYDSTGNYLGLLNDSSDPVLLPRAVIVDKNRLFVSLSEGHSIKVFRLGKSAVNSNQQNNNSSQLNSTTVVNVIDKNSSKPTNSVTTTLTTGINYNPDLIVASDTINLLGLDGSVIKSFQPFSNINNDLFVAYADFNGDGSGEIVAVEPGSRSTVGLFDGNGNRLGTFSVDAPVVSLAASDIDGDGVADMVVSTGKDIEIYGIANDSLLLKDVISEAAEMVAAGDVDGDGSTDMVIYNNAGELKVIDMAGNIKDVRVLNVAPVSIKMADLNGSGSDSIVIATSNGDIFTLDGVQIKVNGNISDITIKDINNDGNQEIIVALTDGNLKMFNINGQMVADVSTGLQSVVNITTGQIGY